MRVNFEILDCLWGIIVGVVLLGLAGTFFALPNIPLLWGILFAVSAVTTIIDVVLCLKDFHDIHKLLLLGIVLSSIVYLIVEIGMTSLYFDLSIPFITGTIVPILSQSMNLLYIGVFFIVTSIIWLIDTAKAR